MIVWVVLRNGKVDEVFDNEAAAIHHRKQLTHKWNLTDLIMKVVLSI